MCRVPRSVCQPSRKLTPVMRLLTPYMGMYPSRPGRHVLIEGIDAGVWAAMRLIGSPGARAG